MKPLSNSAKAVFSASGPLQRARRMGSSVHSATRRAASSTIAIQEAATKSATCGDRAKPRVAPAACAAAAIAVGMLASAGRGRGALPAATVGGLAAREVRWCQATQHRGVAGEGRPQGGRAGSSTALWGAKRDAKSRCEARRVRAEGGGERRSTGEGTRRGEWVVYLCWRVGRVARMAERERERDG
eukprot:361873-Chlamydomonas_euryale.AAC.4